MRINHDNLYFSPKASCCYAFIKYDNLFEVKSKIHDIYNIYIFLPMAVCNCKCVTSIKNY